MESLILNILNFFSTVGETPQYKLLFCEIIEDLGQLNHELFIPLSGIINTLAEISDLEAEIGDTLTRKFQQLDVFEIRLHLFHMLKGYHENDLKHTSQDTWTRRCGQDCLKSITKESDMEGVINVQPTPFQGLELVLIPIFPQLFHI